MVDVRREDIIAYALKRLADASFRRQLTAVAEDGTRPIIPALLSDKLSDVVLEVHRHAGAGNVVIPLKQGYFLCALHVTPTPGEQASAFPMISPDVTMGVMIARLFQDGGTASYTVPDGCEGWPEVASTELVGAVE